VVQVADTGPGISSEQQSMLFKEFTRLAPSVAHGTGIGLAISQRIAHALGGAITVDSKEGAGSTFTLWLPITEGAGTGVRDAGGSARNAGDRS
jgi:signal transduction histidine kinase